VPWTLRTGIVRLASADPRSHGNERDSAEPREVIRRSQGACSCNGAPSLAPFCSSRCSPSCRRSPCSHTRDGRNRADRFVRLAYQAPSRIHPARGVPLVSIRGGASRLPGLTTRGSVPIGPRATFESPEQRPDFRSLDDCADPATSGPEWITAVVWQSDIR